MLVHYNIKDLYVAHIGIVYGLHNKADTIYCKKGSLDKEFVIIRKTEYGIGPKYPLGISVVKGTRYKNIHNKDIYNSRCIGTVMIDSEVPLSRYVKGNRINIYDIIKFEDYFNASTKYKPNQILYAITKLATICSKVKEKDKRIAFLNKLNNIGASFMAGLIVANSSKEIKVEYVIYETKTKLKRFIRDLNNNLENEYNTGKIAVKNNDR